VLQNGKLIGNIFQMDSSILSGLKNSNGEYFMAWMRFNLFIYLFIYFLIGHAETKILSQADRLYQAECSLNHYAFNQVTNTNLSADPM